MTPKFFLFILIVVFSVQFSCQDSDSGNKDTGVMKSSNYVQTYIAANDFDLKEAGDSGEYVIGIYFKGERISILHPANEEKFEKIAKSFHDVSYTGYVVPDANQALSEPLSFIGIICDKNYDADHDAGQSLEDIVLFCAISPYEFIQNGYKNITPANKYPDYWYGMIMNRDGGYRPIEMQVNAINCDNSSLLYPICYLYFRKGPINGGEYVFTVTIKIGNTEIVKNIKHQF